MSSEVTVEIVASELNSYITTIFAQQHISGKFYDNESLKNIIIEKLNALGNQKAKEQFERDCKAACVNCLSEGLPIRNKEKSRWYHRNNQSKYPMICSASNIRNKREQEIIIETRIFNR